MSSKMTLALSKAICELDIQLWKHYYPDHKSSSTPKPDNYNGHLWLEEDISTILSDPSFDFDNTFLQKISFFLKVSKKR